MEVVLRHDGVECVVPIAADATVKDLQQLARSSFPAYGKLQYGDTVLEDPGMLVADTGITAESVVDVAGMLTPAELGYCKHTIDNDIKWNRPDPLKRLAKEVEKAPQCPEVVLYVVAKDPRGIRSAAASLKDNPDFLREAVKVNPDVVQYCKRESVTKEIALEAVTIDGLQLEHLWTMNDDKDVVLAAVKEMGHALQYASK
eukprot:Sspe_Gene.83030::Locus_54461_Transcript_1_1_Confidence_1.000_Length_634::g.83030::m.83030